MVRDESIYSESEAFPVNLSMTVLLISLSMLFATLFMAYTIYRAASPVWPPAGFHSLDLKYPILSSVFILFSSFHFHWAQSAFKTGHRQKSLWQIYLSLSFGLGFLISQCLLWHTLKMGNFLPEHGIFPSLIYSFTWIHAAHIVAGIGTLLWARVIIGRSIVDREESGTSSRIKQRDILRMHNIGKFWHFLGVIWFIIFFGTFVI